MEKNKLGMVLFLASEAVFFTLLIVAYVYLHNRVGSGPSAASSLDPRTTFIYSLFLFASSLTVWLAGRGRARWLWLLATILLGLVFLAGQALEWARLLGSGTTVSTDLFGTTFFTLTGFHGLHVTIGLIALMILLALTLGGRLSSRRSAALETIAIYWHFVDAVWIVIFAAVYLTALLRL
jgi:heme/copper-type cytochrome/quinol oxidase subunit 3